MWVAGVDCDVASPSSVQRLVESAAAQLGSIDVWINNAGCSGTFQARACRLALATDAWLQKHAWGSGAPALCNVLGLHRAAELASSPSWWRQACDGLRPASPGGGSRTSLLYIIAALKFSLRTCNP